MTTEQIEDEIQDAAGRAIIRFLEFSNLPPDSDPKIIAAGVAEYLTGITQACEFLSKCDGDLTPQQILKAVYVVGPRIGFVSEAVPPDE